MQARNQSGRAPQGVILNLAIDNSAVIDDPPSLQGVLLKASPRDFEERGGLGETERV